MASEARLRANRINARRSTGPRTQEGKERTKFNALKHGLASKFVVLPYENDAEYNELRAALLHEYEPMSASELFLVDQLAQNWWRLNRARRYETGTLSALSDSAPAHADLECLRRYEASIERAYYRAYDRLEKIVRRRPKPVETVETTPIGFVSQNEAVRVAYAPSVQPLSGADKEMIAERSASTPPNADPPLPDTVAA